MAKPFPKEFQDDVVAVARKAQAPLAQIAKDFGIATSTLRSWLQRADAENGFTTSSSTAGSDVENRELKKRVRLLEQENEVLRRAAIYLGKDVLPK